MRSYACFALIFGIALTCNQLMPLNSCSAQPAADPNLPSGTQLVIKRDAIHLISPDQFRVPISLKPTRQLDVRALVEGIIQNVRVKTGAKVSAQEEVLRIESAKATKLLERAKANVKAATLRRDLAKTQVGEGKQPQAALDLAQAELDVAEVDLDLAQLNFDNTSVRAPFQGEILQVTAVQGAFVNEGDLLMSLRDSSELSVRIPVNRNEVKAGDQMEVTLDTGSVTGTVQTILPLTEEWQALRQLIDTAAIAVVVIDNKSGQYHDGQTAYSNIVPRQPVIELANTSLNNSETGTRIVQVIRDNVVRDIEVKLLGPVGEGRSYVSGPLQERDELITESSQSLVDGTVVIPANPAKPASTPNRPGNTPVNPGNTPAF
ncbi:HlyD family efflux transporter periplasmic adaptor subunit [Rubinisphaera sp.]|uniref:efflux RND transporter periplasmic adaptor subunit n=1 Tax=Rubinisphaera sp. TaxID=2024857 RepID=UPI000C117B0B|nr:HlyD family efflux transporter periplasmic adaptor subunit [Rubinisphaera sp.]MBV08129.1 hypothetical protein [Rubinisphaera sp.]HCS54257.1 hypothetical protein [Planctomycetaceae bacterium]|tara:strand:- start:1628 stop:2755 length:1128 start_codon:yes stop_codon:yes gene_type:complete